VWVCGHPARPPKRKGRKIEGECSGKNRNSAPSSGHRCAHFSPHSFSFSYGLALRLPHALPPGFRPPSFLRHSCLPFLPSSPPLLPISHFPTPVFFRPSTSHASRYSNRFATARGRPRPTPRFLKSFHACRSGTPGHRPPLEL
jgi:hypothetical protein